MTPVHALVADDEDITLRLLAAWLQHLGCDVTTAHNGEQAITALDSAEFNLVVTDLQMGETNGLEVLKKAKQQNSETVVFIITGCSEEAPRTAAQKMGVDDYLPKPLSMEYLLERLLQTPVSLPCMASRTEFCGKRRLVSK